MITINSTIGNEVEGLNVNDDLELKVFGPTATPFEKTNAVGDMIKSYMALIVSIKDGITLSQAELYVTTNSSRIQ